MKYQGKSMMSLNEMAGLAIDYERDGYVTGYPIVSGDDAYILNGVIEANEEYITINQWVPVFPESLKPVSPLSLTDDQKVVLEWWVKKLNEVGEDADPLGVICAMQSYGLHEEKIYDAAVNLTPAQQFQVLAAFVEWGSKEEE